MHQEYRPDIDGLRGIAVLAVVIYHTFPSALPFGFLGVDLFFVISGYLITGDIIARQDAGTFTLADFYRRRIRRIFPALLLVLVCTAALGWFLLVSHEFKSLMQHTVASVFFVQNFNLLREVGYFDTEAQLKPLLHLWSLSIEEQFYLLWPLVLIVCPKAQRMRVTLALCAASVAAFLLMPDAYYWPVARFWEILAGAALAISGRAFVLPFVSARWLVGVGLISYPLYLWHWPLLSFLQIVGDTSVGSRVAVVAASFGLALLTYRLLERPVRRGGRRAVKALLAGMGATVCASSLAWAGIAPRSEVDVFTEAAKAWRFPGNSVLSISGDLEVRTLGTGPATLFIGDSFAQQYFPRVEAVLPKGRRAVFVTKPSCSVIPGVTRDGKCPDFGSRAVDYAMQAGADTIVIAENFYADMATPGAAEAFDLMLERLTTKARVYVVLPQPRMAALHSMLRRSLAGPAVVPQSVARSQLEQPMRSALVSAARKHGAEVIEPADSVCSEVCSAVWPGGPVYYADGMHFSVGFVRERGGFIDPVLR